MTDLAERIRRAIPDNSIWSHERQSLLTEALAALSPSEGAIPAGMVPWQGGDNAPEDWDGGPVLLRGLHGPEMWGDAQEWEHQDNPVSDIIAYTPKATPSEGRGGEEDAAEVFAREYVMSTEGNDYVPTDWERELITDALRGWLAETPLASRGGVSLPDREGIVDAITERDIRLAYEHFQHYAEHPCSASALRSAFILLLNNVGITQETEGESDHGK